MFRQFVSRTISVVNPCCSNANNYPSSIQVLYCGSKIIETDITAGDYFVSTGYDEDKQVRIESSNTDDWITLRNASTQEFILHGQSPLQFTYLTGYGNIEVHINKNQSCDTRPHNKNHHDIKKCDCDNDNQWPDNTFNLSCGENIISNNQYSDQHNLTSGYINLKIIHLNHLYQRITS
ncbi:MAG: hypothetical protein IPO92_20120 [Saprospiraceae bacterium]|nr:hypothetical protein [Saprospiraceae bacterium]